MGFKYVLIPCSANEDMKELEFETDITDLSSDTFRTHVEGFFAALNQTADKAVLMEQLQKRTGIDVQEKAKSGELMEGALEKLMSATSVEIFPVLLPTKDTDFIGLSVYCDDKGVAKDLEENPRASGLVQSAGYPGQTFRGDVFIGKVFDDNEDEWRRIDFTLKDCSTDADWVQVCKKQRSNRSSSDMASLASKVGANNPAHINPAMLADSSPSGDTDKYKWRQTEEEVEVTFKKEGLQKGDKKAVKVAFARERLKVEAKGEVLIDSKLHAPTNVDECTWTLSDGELQVTLAKASSISWAELTRG